MSSTTPRLYTSTFWLLCLSHGLFAASFTMIIPELPAYLTSLGGEDYKGLIISLFTLTAGISRPFSGKLSDTIGRVPVMIVGVLVCVVASLMYPLVTTVGGFLALRLFHGFSTGFKPTATSAYGADIIPADRRGEGMGILGVSLNTGASAAPPIGGWLVQQYSVDMMFYASSMMALLSILILIGLKETLTHKQPFQWRLLLIRRDELFEPTAIKPGMVTLLVYFCFGALLTITPDQSVYLGMENKGLFYASFTAMSLVSRLVAGRLSDRLGRVPIIRIAIVMMSISIILVGLANSPMTLLAASGCLGFSLGIAAPAIFAWTIDRSQDDNRGRALATVYIALELGIGLGALTSAWLYANDVNRFLMTYSVMALVTVLALPYLYWRKHTA
ncbi:MAG: MFS transporter [Bacteroidota bacterium]